MTWMNLPEKNCAISSLEQPNGNPLSRTHPSSIAFSRLNPLLLITHSISPRFALKTVKIKLNLWH